MLPGFPVRTPLTGAATACRAHSRSQRGWMDHSELLGQADPTKSDASGDARPHRSSHCLPSCCGHSLSKCFAVLSLLLAIGLVGFVPFGSGYESASTSHLGDRILLSLYFSAVTLTTVGFGDIVPVTAAAKLFVCFYIVCGISALGYVLSNAVNSILEVQARSFLHAMDRTHAERVVSSRRAFRATRAVAVLLVTVTAGAAFYWNARNDREVVDCVYFAVVTATTVGYGDFQPASDGERAGAAVYCLVSTAVVAWSLGVLVDCLIDLEGADRQREIAMLFQRANVADLRAADMDGDGAVSEAEYVIMKLKHMGKTTEGEIAAIRARFRLRDKDGDRLLSINESGEVL
eukprot:COSAG02_NODE_13139_length_1440_cov_1.246831_1_plen_347_part_00